MRVVITGFGFITPLGGTKEEIIDAMKNSKCSISKIKSYDIINREVQLASEIDDSFIENEFDKKDLRRLDRVNQLGLIAAKRAAKNAKLSAEEIKNCRSGVYVSSGIGGIDTIEKEHNRGLNRGFDKISPYFIPKAIVNLTAANIAMELKAYGACLSPVTACSSSTNAIGEAYRAIKHGYEDIIFAGGSEASITELGVGGFTSMKALSTSKDSTRASIPFDKDRNGFVMGEGAGILVLESFEHATKRGANILAEIVGYATNCDAFHITSPAPNGEFAALAMKNAIYDADISPENIDYVNAHGTSTELNDKFETSAIKKVFKNRNVKVSSTKSQIGHLLGASGAVETIFSICAMNENFLPPLVNYKNKDEDCDLNFALEPEDYNINYFIKNSLGFGGHNASIVIKRYSDDN